MTPLVDSPRIRMKTGSQSLGDKCHLRRLVVHEAKLESLYVLDLFAGEGAVWKRLREEPKVENGEKPLEVVKYTPVDQAAKQSGQIRMKITPRLIAALDISRFNVIDIDPYGDPWLIWSEVLQRIERKTAVFVTRGKVTYGAGRMPISNHSKAVLGIPQSWNVPGKIELLDFADRCQLLQQCETAHITAGWKTELPRVDYYGLIVEPTA